MLFMAEIIPFSRRIYYVYRYGHEIYRHTTMFACFSYVAGQLSTNPEMVTVKQAMDAGFEIRDYGKQGRRGAQ